MKSKLVGYLISAAFVVVVVAIISRIPAVKSFVFGSSATA